ncbi:MAG: ChaN family lipoprotein, partial [Gammaproteobacteria bacterium]
WDYYREIFLLAKQHAMPMKALNAPRPVITQFRKQGRDALTEEQAKHLPANIDTDSVEHLKLFKSYFDADDPIHGGMTEAQWQGMFQAQCAWDAVMGFNALRALEDAPDNAVVVVLVGAGHVVYGQGIARQIANWSDVAVATVTPVPAANSHGEPIDQVQASYGDFLWGLPGTQPPRYPVLGTATIDSKSGGLTIIDLDSHSAAARAGLKVGDRITGLDAVQIVSRRDMNIAMARYRWGDQIEVRVQREDNALTLPLTLTRTAAGQ